MITSRDKELIIRLIKKYAANVSTDRMLAYIADNTGMLAVCRLLVQKNNEDDREAISWVDEQCHQRQVDVRNFLYEMQQILSVFQPDQQNDEHFQTLGLEAGATAEEIKDAYRRLSLRYHPDTSSSNSPEDAAVFIRINKAYQALQDIETAGEPPPQQPAPARPTHWKPEQRKSTLSAAKKKKNILWFSALTLVMVVVSILAARGYQKKAMITGLKLQQAAFIPPDSAVIDTSDSQGSFLDEPVTHPEQAEASEPSVEPDVEPVVQTQEPDPGKQADAQESVAAEEEPVMVEPVPPVIVEEENVQATEDGNVQEKKETAKVEKEKVEIASPKPSPNGVEEVKPVAVIKTAEPKKPVVKKPVKKAAAPVVILPAKQSKTSVTPKDSHNEMQERIEQFLKEYTAAYRNRNLAGFTRFFNEQTTENGKLIKEVLPTYKELFQSANGIRLDISILKWEKIEGEIQLDGRFVIRIDYKNGKKVKGNGEIRFFLKDLSDTFLVREMQYQFDK